MPSDRRPLGVGLVVVALLLAGTLPASAQRVRRGPAQVECPSRLGDGLASKRSFCDVPIGTDPAEGVRIAIPRHRGTATLSFDLHNRHIYSEDLVESGRGFAQYTATIGVLTMEGDLIDRAVILSEFRTAEDLVDRVPAEPDSTSLKAVAPLGAERVHFRIPAAVREVAVLGESLEIVRREGRELYAAPGRPIALISNVTIEYRPR